MSTRRRPTVRTIASRVRHANTVRTGTNRRVATVERRVRRAVAARTGQRA
jgi:hypothetical protein